MSLSEKLRAELDRLASEGKFANGPETIQITYEGDHLHCQIAALGSVGCTVDVLTVRTDKLADSSSDQLQEIASKLASRLTYLLEPISTIEVDPEGCVVQLRSDPPHRAEDSSNYYELLVRRGGELALCRYSKEPNQDRLRVAAQLTLEVLFRLVDDFATAVVA